MLPYASPHHKKQLAEVFLPMAGVSVGRVEDFPPEGRKVVSIGDTVVGVFHLHGEFYAWHSECPHQGGPVCQGRLFRRVTEPVAADGTVHGRSYDEEAVNIVCPWHGYEYDVRTGRHPGNPKIRLRPVHVKVEGGEVLLEL
jgi:nitrite reductase (NADH) small subunit